MNTQVKQRIDQIRRGEVPEGYKKTKVGIVPVEWEDIRFQDITSKTGKDKNNNEIEYPVYSINNKTGFSPQDDQFANSGYSNTSKELYKVVYKNEFAYNPARINVGSIGLLKAQNAVIISSLYVCFKMNNKCNTPFFEQYFKSHRFNFDVNNYTEGSVREYLFYDNFSKIHTALPPLPEQQKIAEILTMQDKLIELQARKIEQLQALKKACLQRMFPKKGCDRPEIRFPEFTDAWEQREFSKFTFPAGEKNKNDLPLEPYAITNEHGFIAQSEAHDDFGYMQNVDRTMYIIVKPNSFAYNPARINVGSLGYYEGTENVIVSSLYEVFQTADYVDDVFLNYWFKTKNFMDWIAKLQEGSVRQYFYYDKLCECKMSMPSVAEQQQIGSYFRNLDHLITLHQRKLDEEKQKKKALMQLLLTGIVRVKI